MSFALLMVGFAMFGANDDQCALCHMNAAPTAGADSPAPVLPAAYQMEWDMYEFGGSARPPFAPVPAPTGVIHGATYYDWSRQSMTEVYKERCIDIFPAGRDYPCQFTSVGDKTYFITPNACCQWRKTPFWAPRPDVLRVMKFDQDLALDGAATRWWLLDTQAPGPFGYGVAADTGLPEAFWFPVISGWVQQVFRGASATAPDPSRWALPAACTAADVPACDLP